MTGVTDALAVAVALRDLGREEHERIGEGRMELLEELAHRRAELLHQLDDALPPGQAVPDDVRVVLDDVRREGEGNLALLRSMQAEFVSQLESDQRVGHAVRSYGGRSRI